MLAAAEKLVGRRGIAGYCFPGSSAPPTAAKALALCRLCHLCIWCPRFAVVKGNQAAAVGTGGREWGRSASRWRLMALGRVETIVHHRAPSYTALDTVTYS